MGHFLVAKYNGVQVKTFSIGYGPKIFSWMDKAGTRWCLSLIPLGGYVMMLGDADASSTRSDVSDLSAEEKSKTLASKTPLQKTAVAFGGPLMNIIFTLLIFLFIGIWKGLPEMQPKIDSVAKGSVAEVCGLQKGDVITGIADADVQYVSEMSQLLEKNAGKTVVVRYSREGSDCATEASLWKEGENKEKIPLKVLGINIASELIFVKTSVWAAVAFSVMNCYRQAVAFFSGIAGFLSGKGGGGMKIGGILAIGDLANKSLSGGFVIFLNFMAMLSFSLAICNLVPIPALDGGSIAINLIEFVRRKPLSPSTINWVYSIGIMAVIGLMLLATWNDLVNYGVIKKISTFFKSLFFK
jgi:regulator of sigma E protease